nr:c-type cytochrome [uncultured Allomuricauda sp.]
MYVKKKTYWNSSNYLVLFILVCFGLLVSSCDNEARGFALPEGDIDQGKLTYERLACNSCHSISGIAWKGGSDSLNILLGGEVSSKKTYGELVTSVINPSHKIAPRYKKIAVTKEGDLKMDNYNYIMTVQELIDLVTFLQSEYKVEVPKTNYYPYY